MLYWSKYIYIYISCCCVDGNTLQIYNNWLYNVEFSFIKVCIHFLADPVYIYIFKTLSSGEISLCAISQIYIRWREITLKLRRETENNVAHFCRAHVHIIFKQIATKTEHNQSAVHIHEELTVTSSDVTHFIVLHSCMFAGCDGHFVLMTSLTADCYIVSLSGITATFWG